jgi:Protein of unknown function (DUF3223)
VVFTYVLHREAFVGKAREIKTATRTFPKVGDATAFYSGILNSYALGARVSAADSTELEALLKLHREYVQKVGVGIDHFEVRLPLLEYQKNSKRCFWIIRADGTADDFSIGHCLK